MEESSSAYRRSLALNPHQPLARLELADVLVQQGHFQEALEQLDARRGKTPEAQHLSLMARVAWESGDREEVLRLLDEAADRDVDHPDLFSLRGQLAQAEGRLDEAKLWLDRAVDADPYDSRRYAQRASILRTLGRADLAESDARTAEELKRAVEEMSALNAEAAEHPLDPEVRCQLGRLCERLGKLDLAASWYRAALACDPEHEEARASLATLGR